MLLQTLIYTTTKRLLKIKGFSEIKVEKIKEAAKKLNVSSHLIMADALLLIISSLLPVALSLLLSLDRFVRSASESQLVASSLIAS